MITRQEYINGYTLDEAGAKLHQDYYAQFVDEGVKRLVANSYGIEMLTEVYRKYRHFNTIVLCTWESLAQALELYTAIPEKLKEYGDSWNLSGGVCILKEAARQLVEGTK